MEPFTTLESLVLAVAVVLTLGYFIKKWHKRKSHDKLYRPEDQYNITSRLPRL